MASEDNGYKLNELITRAYRTINLMEDAKIKRNSHLDVTNSELHLMEEISKHPYGATITQLAKSMSCTLPTMTVTVKNLVKKGYAVKVKSPDDKRELRVYLTKTGGKLNTVHLYLHRRISRQIANSFSEEEQEVLIRGMEKIIELFSSELYRGRDK